MTPRFSPDYRISDFVGRAPKNLDKKLQLEMASRTGLDSHFFFKYGRSGLYFLLLALGIKNKKIVMPSYSCVVVAHAIVKSGNIPVFLDSDPPSFQPKPARYLEAIDSETAMVIPTHLFGFPEETSELYREIKEKHPHVFVMQDCAHSYFCKDSTGRVVTEYGDGALFGANISKLVNGVHAGILSLRSEAHAKKVQSYIEKRPLKPSKGVREFVYAVLAGIAFQPLLYGLVYFLKEKTSLLDSEVKYYSDETIELPSDFDESLSRFSKKILLNSLRRFDQRVEKRRKIVQSYHKFLEPLKKRRCINYLSLVPGATWSHFPVYVPGKNREIIADKIRKILNSEIGIIVDYSIPSLDSYIDMKNEDSIHSNAYGTSVINLPLEKGIEDNIVKELLLEVLA